MPKRILYVGDLWYGSTALWRMRALEQLGFAVEAIDSTRLWTGWRARIQNFAQKMKIGMDAHGINNKLLQRARQGRLDAVWIDKGIWTKPAVLSALKLQHPNAVLISYSPDDMFNPINQTTRYLKSLRLYDHVITTKRHNVTEFEALGVKNVHYVHKAYDPTEQRMYPLTDAERVQFGSEVGFVGNFEHPRFQSMLRLAQAGIRVSIRGAAWRKIQHQSHLNLDIDPKNYFGDSYAKILQATKINLGFLHKGNRDQHTARSIEIPACGGFLLAERTTEHQELFEEGKEAVFFGTDDELIEKVRYYLAHENERRKIAAAGYERCIKSQYDNYHVFNRLIDRLFE